MCPPNSNVGCKSLLTLWPTHEQESGPMSARLALPERQVTALCRGAAKAGHIAVVNIGGVLVHLIPKQDAQLERPIDLGEDIRP